MYDAKSEPIINMINDTIAYIENEVKNAEVREDFWFKLYKKKHVKML